MNGVGRSAGTEGACAGSGSQLGLGSGGSGYVGERSTCGTSRGGAGSGACCGA